MRLPLPFFVLLLALAGVGSACGEPEPRAGLPGDSVRTGPRTPEDALAAAERASAAGEPDTVPVTAAPGPAVVTDAGRSAGPAAEPAGAEGTAAAPPAQPGDSAGRILERAAAKYAALQALQADFTMVYENPLLRSRMTGEGTLYQKRPDRLLLRFSEPAGDIILSDGRYFWVYYPSVDREQVLRSEASPDASAGVDLQAQFLGDPTRRFHYTLDGEEVVAGRPAWVLTLRPRERLGYRQLRVWIDKRDHLARRFEITEDNSSLRRFELRNLRPDAALADALFRFEVPAGARVIAR